MYPRSLIKKIGPFRSKLKAPIDFKRFFLFRFFCRFSKKNAVFWPKIDRKKVKFFKILGIDKNTINASYDKILGNLNNFLAKYGRFFAIFGPFWPYYKGKSWKSLTRCSKRTHAIGRNFWTAYLISMILGILESQWKGLEVPRIVHYSLFAANSEVFAARE